MKNLLVAAALLFSASSFAQSNNNKSAGTPADLQNPDTAIRVVYVDRHELNKPAYIINGRFLKNSSLDFIVTPENIENIDVLRGDTLIENITYSGQIRISTKRNHLPEYITLTKLKDKYTNLRGTTVLFMLDGNFVNADYDTYLVNERSVLTITVDKLKTNEKSELGLIKLLSRTDANIKSRKTIMIRGSDLAMHE